MGKKCPTCNSEMKPVGAGRCPTCGQDSDAIRAVFAPFVSPEQPRLWLWKNFVDGRPEYWAFDNPYPCHPNGDPMTLGEPCGYAIAKDSTRGRTDVSDAEVVEAIKRAVTRSESAPTLHSALLGEWTPRRVLHLDEATEIEELCKLLNGMQP